MSAAGDMPVTAAPDVDVVVIGGGVAGLVVAHGVARAGGRVVLLESGDEVGGLLRRGELAGRAFDLGAESFATRTTGVADLIADAALDLEIVAPEPGGAHLAAQTPDGIVRAPLPRRTVLGIPADPQAEDVVRILGSAAAARAAAERDLPAWDAGGTDPEPSLADLVTARCGPELTRRLVDPLCRSVYSLPAASARLSRLHPTMWREVQRTGSLLTAADTVAAATQTGSAVAGIAGGMWRLPAALRAAAEAHGARVHTGAAVHGIRTDGDGDATVVWSGGELRARHVVVSTGSRAAVTLLGGETAPPSAPVRVIAALVRSAALDAHPVGTGVIVAPDVPSAAKALTHVSAKWAWARGDSGHLVRLSARDAAAPGLDTPAQLAAEIALLTGVPLTAADVVATAAAVWDDAVAVAPAAPDRLAALAARGIHVAGAAVAGTGLASVVPHARALAATLTSSLTPTIGARP
ncbi:FAD-dependent oxidoreductase [Microbacterium sp. W1N]|uniref:protoporphyrinogen/coproporphyrinogen oxidase n=1 Tax=Microbacterium festucae TaxID=2977531 RepID=UPI0021C0F16B|nr:FAD-dependent oxidoreductase [Microbacterium festucae]MCT9820615.1 FAD-dependent oxidoreductase [Microbacterium festucae]